MRRGLHEIGEHNHVLELGSEPDKVERILVDINLFGQGSCIVTAQP